MEHNTFRVLFYVKKTKPLKNGDLPVFARITVNGERAEMSLNRGVPPELWDAKRNRAKGHAKPSRELNDYLISVSGQLYNHHKELHEAGKLVSAVSMRNSFLGISERQDTLVDVFNEHNENMRELIGKEFAPLTVQRYETALNHLVTYMKVAYGKENVSLKEIDHRFITGFEHYLKSTVNCQHNSAMKHMKALKKVVRIAMANGDLRTDPFVSYKISVRPVDKEFLTKGEMKMLADKEFTVQRIGAVRDIFLFQCLTGLAYSDLAKLTPSDIREHVDGKLWVITERTKTGVKCNVPLLPMAKDILERYNDHPCRIVKGKLLPVPSNQKMNAYLKEVGDLCGLKKELTTHMARHTFATTVTLSNGIPIESVAKMLGHRKLSSTQIYAKVLDGKVGHEMDALRGRF